MQRRLSHIGVVSKSLGQALQPQLKPGQRLVSREGDVWRWDGFTAAADAPSAAAKRLAERTASPRPRSRNSDAAAEEAQGYFGKARRHRDRDAPSDKREGHRAAVSAVDFARRALTQHERQVSERLALFSALDEAQRRIEKPRGGPCPARGGDRGGRRAAGAGRAADRTPQRVAQQREQRARRPMPRRGRNRWAERGPRPHRPHPRAILEAERSMDGLRRARQRADRTAHRPRRGNPRRRYPNSPPCRSSLPTAEAADASLAEAEAEKKAALDALQTAENEVRQADQSCALCRNCSPRARSMPARRPPRGEHRAACGMRTAHHRDAELRPGRGDFRHRPRPRAADEWHDIERKLQGLREDRERLGGVNLRADEEAEEGWRRSLEGLVKERDDLIQAINKLRGGISSLNREAAGACSDAFETVNQKFGELFTTLFGGKAETAADRIRRSAGGRPRVDRQPAGQEAHHAVAALGRRADTDRHGADLRGVPENPSPICVLDEVDAPLDDHNVERFCNLLDAMLERTETRFLIITHHALTMARMHRLFGVTMLERGVLVAEVGETSPRPKRWWTRSRRLKLTR
ncbi:MAG: hypothetical protein U1E16_04775 [Hyphomicrobiales bacterium]